VSGDLDRRLAALAEAARLAEDRLDQELVDEATAVTRKAGARLGLGVEKTVVALAGPTGAGKSLLFNALTGTELAAVGRRRPTTAMGQGAAWGDAADPLFDWLDIGRRHRLNDGELDGLVLIDLPDFDSIETSHRLEVDRVVALADLVVWVVEPQKYADAALHERYLRPLASHAAAMAVVLNQVDVLTTPEVAAWHEDAERLLRDDGITGVPLVLTSARTGDGLPELRALLRRRVAARDAAVARLAADVDAAARSLGASCRDERPPGVRREDRQRLVVVLEDAGGVPAAVDAVHAAHRHRGTLATGWPFVRWVRRFRPDPLRRLRLPETPHPAVRTSLQPATDVQRAQVVTAARRLADRAGAGLAPPWPTLIRRAAVAEDEDVADRLDRAVAGANLHVSTPRWWTLVGVLQRLFAAAVAAGLVWLLALAVLGYLRVDDLVPVPEIRDVPIPTWLVVGGSAAGIALALLARLANAIGARRRAAAAARSLRRGIEAVAEERIIGPVEAELDAYERICAAVAEAAAERRPR
jgi:GTP-binding protein EngB required for normal cell division